MKLPTTKEILSEYVNNYFDPNISVSKRIAHFLDWVSSKYGMHFFTAGQIAYAVRGGSKIYSDASKEALEIRKKMKHVKAFLIKSYQRQLHALPGLGYRASVDDNDIAANAMPSNIKRIESAHKALDITLGLINKGALTADNRRAFLAARNISEAISEPTFQDKLLAAKKPENN